MAYTFRFGEIFGHLRVLNEALKSIQSLQSCGLTRIKLDRLGPVDNRPSTGKLHHFGPKKGKLKITWDT